MALWQFKTELIPTECINDRQQLDEADFDNDVWWNERQPPADYREQLAALLPPTKSWHENLMWFGQENGDRIDLWQESGRVRSIGFHIDCSKLNSRFVETVAVLARQWSCTLVELRYLKVLPTNPADLLQKVLESPSCRFMENPSHWLPKLAAEVEAGKRATTDGDGKATD